MLGNFFFLVMTFINILPICSFFFLFLLLLLLVLLLLVFCQPLNKNFRKAWLHKVTILTQGNITIMVIIVKLNLFEVDAWRAMLLCLNMLLFSCSVVSDSFATTWTISPPGSSVHGISQARMLDWVTISFSRGSSYPGIEPASPALAGRFFTTGAIREACLNTVTP